MIENLSMLSNETLGLIVLAMIGASILIAVVGVGLLLIYELRKDIVALLRKLIKRGDE